MSKSNALRPEPHKHASKPSLDTNASGIAESAISYSAFPEPPSSIPTTPIRSVFGSPSPSLRIPAHSLSGTPQVITGSISPSSNRFSRSTFDRDSTRPLISQQVRRDNDTNSGSGSISAHDWHEGASSIDVDAAEDRLLPTSFITSLLQENAGPRGANRASYSSDAISGISEMTYPPRNPYINSLRDSSAIPSRNPSRRQSLRAPLTRPVGGRSPSSGHFQGRRNGAGNSCDHDSTQPTSTPQRSSSRPGHTQTLARSGLALSQSTLINEQSESNGKPGGKLQVYSEVDESDEGGHQDAYSNSSSGFAASGTNLAQQHPNQVASFNPCARDSIHSNRSAAPSFISRISSLRYVRRALTRRRKPLPPVPTIPHIPIAMEREHRRMEEQAPLPDLVNRANHLHGLLEKGYHPHQSISSCPTKSERFTTNFEDAETSAQYHNRHQNRKPSPAFHSRAIVWLKGNKIWVVLGVFVIIAIIAIGSAVGVTARRNKVQKSSCPANVGGAGCNLNATCVCTTTPSPCGSPVAQAVLDLIPIANDQFSTNLTASTVYNSFWIVQGSVQGSSCDSQIELIDVGFALDSQRYPNRTQWAQAALLWTLTQTQDHDPIAQLLAFIKKAPWAQLQNSDGPTGLSGTSFTTSAAGFNYDFAAQTIKPLPATFATQGQASNEQISKVDTQIRPSLDHLYSYAVASSTQRDKALLNYWTGVLHQREDSLAEFKNAFTASPIILPFDANFQSIRDLYRSGTFPPPPACYPGLGSDQRKLIDTVEGEAFNLTPLQSAPSQFNTTCFPLHPIYGILDVLRLRLPFLDSRNNTARQGITLKSDVAPRAILAVGEALSALPGSVNATRGSAALADPRSYGTTTYASHIILQYLSSVSSNTANAIISRVLDSSTTVHPPPNPTSDSSLFPLESIPILEVAVFGNIDASDTSSYVSSFTTSSGSLFFGSSDGSAFRAWAIDRGGQIAWAENATSPEVVYDNTFSDNIFNLTWAATSTAIERGDQNVGLANITDTFRKNQRFSP